MDPQRVADVLADRPDLEDPLRTVAAVDADAGTWTFEDVAIDSGAFGELVSRGLVEERDGGYRLADPEAVRAALADGRAVDGHTPGETGLALSLPRVDRHAAVALGGLLLVLAALRTVFSFSSVFRGEHVVLSANDPYYYRYWVETLLSDPTVSVFPLPEAAASGEPLLLTTLWAASALAGGSATAAGWVLAWYPVVAAVLTGLLVYLVTTRLTRDRRVGLAAVAALAVLPAHAYRTSLGFADHHAFDYLWLAACLLALTSVLGNERPLADRRPWLAAAGLGVAVAGQVTAWESSPLLVAPIGVAATALVLVDVRAERSPARWGIPLVGALALASLLTVGLHLVGGWHTALVASTPLFLLAGVAAVVVAGSTARRGGVRWPVLAAGLTALGVVGLAGIRFALPAYWSRFAAGVGRLVEGKAVAEATPLFGSGSGAWLLLFGLLLFVAVPYLGWGTVRLARGDRRWAAPVAYAWVLLALTLFSIRFGGEASVPLAVFAGLGATHVAAWVDVVADPSPFSGATAGGRTAAAPGIPDVRWPDRAQVAHLAVLAILLGGLGLVQIPVKTSQITIPESTYETAVEIDAYAEARGIHYPENYVLSRWDRQRVYNYFVSGNSQFSAFARLHYAETLAGPPQYALPGGAGFVVVGPAGEWPDGSFHEALTNYGEGTELGHYRAVARSGDTRAYAAVRGARVVGTTNATGTTVRLSTNVSIPGWSFTYSRQRANVSGRYTVRVAHPGQYRVRVGGTLRDTVTVSERAVRTGARVPVER
ncbi:MAG: STT3 domain-containing protein [Halorientalis sp.]